MAEINQWVKNLIFVVLITTFLQMFLPEKRMYRYVRVVMGFFIIMIFISPLTAIFNRDFNTVYQVLPNSNINAGWEQIKKRGKEIERSNQSILNDYYSKKVSNKIRQVADLDFPDYKKKIEVEINDYYQLAGIKLKLYASKKIKEIKIDSINMSSDNLAERKKDEFDKNINIKIDSLRNKLAKAFQISVDSVKVVVMNRGEKNEFD